MALRAGLDRATVVRAAAELADEEGLDALTLGSLARRLGVRTPSLYNHVAGLPGLRRDLALLGIRELGRRLGRAAIGTSGDAAISALAMAYRDFARERPGLYTAALHAPDPADRELGTAAQEVVEIILAVLAPYGLHDDAAIHAVRALRSLAHGFVSLEAAGGFGIPLDLDESFQRLIGMYTDALHYRRDP